MTAQERHTILFLAANPLGTDRRALDREARAIQMELKRSRHRDRCNFETQWAVEPLDWLRAIRDYKPSVVHFSGHGRRTVAGPPRNASVDDDPGDSASGGGEHHGLFLQAPSGGSRFVSATALSQAFGATGSVQVVVLSACYSEVQAAVLLAHVDCVVGMSGSIHDDAARSFAIGFYGGLGARESVAAAYRQGLAAISLEGLGDSAHPVLKIREGVDPDHIILPRVPS